MKKSAFPLSSYSIERGFENEQTNGISQRLYIATKIAAGFTTATDSEGVWSTDGCEETIAQMSFRIADEINKQDNETN